MEFLKRKNTQTPRRRSRPDDEERRGLPQYTTFKRNRTLTGSASSSVVAAANELGADIKSPRVQAHELTRKRRHLGAVLGVMLACAAVLFMLILQFTASVVVRTSSDVSTRVETARYEAAIQDYLRSHPAERLRFLLSKEQLLQHVQTTLPEVEAITDESTAGFGQTAFELKMRTPIAGWSINDTQQFVDGTGVVFEKNYYVSPAVQIIDKSGLEVRDASRVASNRFLGFVGRVVAKAKTFDFTVKEVAIPKGATRQVQVVLAGVAYPVKLSIDRPAGEQVEDMTRAVKWLGQKGIKPQYLDVRVENRAFYR